MHITKTSHLSLVKMSLYQLKNAWILILMLEQEIYLIKDVRQSMRIYQYICQISFLKLRIRYCYIKYIYLSNYCFSIFRLFCCKSLEDHGNLLHCVLKKAYIIVFDGVNYSYVRFYYHAESNMILPIIVLMSVCYFQPDINLIKHCVFVNKSELAKPIPKFLITM